METVNATHLKNHLGAVLARAASGPVAIESHGHVVAYLVPPRAPEPVPRPSGERASLGREEEERLLDLCASGDFRLSRWRRAGDPQLLAGVAAMLAAVGMFNRDRLFALAERLYPGMSSIAGLQGWLETGPVRPARFVPMLRARMKSKQTLG
jgi:antitoxin (DNA-binding transcriptional repressor) of toxin-antitoxin stability system